MMNKYFYSDKIEAYILDNLSESERMAFEELIEQDPVLKNELELQQETINSLQNQRKAQLKQRLNNIEVEPVAYSLSRITLLESVLLVSIVATTITLFALFYGTKSNITAEKAAPVNYHNELSFTPYLKLAHIPVAKKENIQEENIPAIVSLPQIKQSKDNYQNVLLKKIKQAQTTKKSTTPRKIEAKREDSGGSSAAVPQNKDLLYQYYNKGFFLLNNESRGYQIPLESHGITKHYLYYQGKVYELKPNQVEPVPPKEVTDQKIIDQVKEHKQLFFGN